MNTARGFGGWALWLVVQVSADVALAERHRPAINRHGLGALNNSIRALERQVAMDGD